MNAFHYFPFLALLHGMLASFLEDKQRSGYSADKLPARNPNERLGNYDLIIAIA